MPIQLIDSNAVMVEAGGTAFRALRVQAMPCDHGTLGSYSYGGFTGILPAALTSNSEIFQFRWTDTTRLAVVRKIVVSASVSTTFFLAGVPIQLDLVKSTGWTAAGTGGTAPTIGSSLKLRTSMDDSLVAANDLRIATTAALVAGTKTIQSPSIAAMLASAPIATALNGTIIEPGTVLFEANTGDGDHPVVLAQNEGLSVRSVAVPATGTWQASVMIAWTEVTAY